MNRSGHWESIYRQRAATEVSWYQREAGLSVGLIQRTTPTLDAQIVDVGGGASTLVDRLLDAAIGPSRSSTTDGPTRCSGLDVVRYTPDAMHAEFGAGFQLLDSVREDHCTPTGSSQPFVYCLCRVEGDGIAPATGLASQ